MLRTIFLMAALFALSAPTPAPEPPPLTPEQRARIGELANNTHRELGRLRALLEDRQRALAAVYGEYSLDEQRATQLEEEILDVQRQMLVSHRKLQRELRSLLSKEWFLKLKKRLDNMLQTAPKTPSSVEPRARE